MPSPEIVHALLSIQTQETLSVPTAALILGALSQVENLIEAAISTDISSINPHGSDRPPFTEQYAQGERVKIPNGRNFR